MPLPESLELDFLFQAAAASLLATGPLQRMAAHLNRFGLEQVRLVVKLNPESQTLNTSHHEYESISTEKRLSCNVVRDFVVEVMPAWHHRGYDD